MKIGVIGAGTMGAGIATSCLAVGDEVVLVDQSDEQAAVALAGIENSLGRLAKKNDAIDVANSMSKLAQGSDLAATIGCELVIEAIPELLEAKQNIFSALEDLHGPDVLLGTNTSSLSIDQIASRASNPDRVIGMHFFNPVPVSALVEVVVGSRTGDAAVDTAVAFAERLDKSPIVVKDSPGFASSRLGLILGLEAIRMVEAGVASPADIDAAMELGYRHPMGPLRLTDLVGLDVRLNIAHHLAKELGDRFAPPQLLVDMVADAKLGKKVGVGFYEW